MDKPTEPGWYEAIDSMKHHCCYWWTGTNLLSFPESVDGPYDLNQFRNFCRLIQKHQPEIIIGDGVTVLRPGVWLSRNIGSVPWWNSHLVESNCSPCVSWPGKEYTRIGDVPEEA